MRAWLWLQVTHKSMVLKAGTGKKVYSSGITHRRMKYVYKPDAILAAKVTLHMRERVLA